MSENQNPLPDELSDSPSPIDVSLLMDLLSTAPDLSSMDGLQFALFMSELGDQLHTLKNLLDGFFHTANTGVLPTFDKVAESYNIVKELTETYAACYGLWITARYELSQRNPR